MLFGLTNAPTTFQTLMNERPFLRQFVLVLFDDILIYNPSWTEHLCDMRLVLAALQAHRLFLKRAKCAFGITEVAYLGHFISAAGVAMDERGAGLAASQAGLRRARIPRSGRLLQAFHP
jgi:hypothetical protein